MRTQESEILAQKIIDASENFIIIPNWDADNYKNNVGGLINDITDLICRDLKNNGSLDVEEKVDTLEDYSDAINGVLKEFHEEHKIPVEPFQHQLRDKKESFAFEVSK